MSVWNFFPKSDNEGIISFDKNFELSYGNNIVEDDLNIDICVNEDITQDILTFIANNGLSPSGNSYILNPKSAKDRVNIVVKNSLTKEILGFVLSIPNTINLKGELIKSGLTTNRCVSLKHRNKKIGQSLISAVIDFGYKNKIYTGYHFIPKAKTESNIEVSNFYRPLNLKLAKECGYQIPDRDFILNSSSDYEVKIGKYEDFVLLLNNNKINRHLNIQPDEKEFINYKNDFECITIFNKSKVVGICIYKSVLLKIAKTNKICPVARLVFMECINKHTIHVMNSIINYLIDINRYIVLSGVCMGNLSNEGLYNKLGIIQSGKSYLDFYNLKISEEHCKASDINVLYV
jgi:hypothetical protein